MTWLYNGSPFTNDMSQGYVGFVYLITDLTNNMRYVGRKVFNNKKAKPPLKGKTKRRISIVDSNWESYFGSGPEIKAAVTEKGEASFKREILHLCHGKAEMGYIESREIFVRDAILRDDYYNSWVSARVNRNQLGKYIAEQKAAGCL
ncbi:putative NAD synthetase protein [Rhizobium phage RHph_I1_18]|nr:putative NAD synthetase protein [Rhizobium phage RHph_I1_18]